MKRFVQILLLLLLILFTLRTFDTFHQFKLLHVFNDVDGKDPKGSLILSQDSLVGFTSSGGKEEGGVVFNFQLDEKKEAFRDLFSFQTGSNSPTGNQPHHNTLALIGDDFYGAALRGGDQNRGVIYHINRESGSFEILHIFKGGIHDGADPHSGPSIFENKLYGMTAKGGTFDSGVIYTMNLDGTGFEVLHSFSEEMGSEPHGQLTLGSNKIDLHGITRKGGFSGGGVIFTFRYFSKANPSYTVLHEFGSFPGDGITSDHGNVTLLNKTLYGMTTLGGSTGNGVIYRIDENGNEYHILHNFGSTPSDGLQPYGSLTVGSRGILYGMTRNGGKNDLGTVFRLSLTGKHYKTLFSFSDETGGHPIDNVYFDQKGLTSHLYGLTQGDTPKVPNGSIFSFIP